MDIQDSLADCVLASRTLLARYLVGFDDSNRAAQAPSLPNHVAWILGHCALTMHRSAERFDSRPLPEVDFIAGVRGDKDRFGSESVAFNSTPVGDAHAYPLWARCRAIFDGGAERLAASIRSAPTATLMTPTKFGGAEMPLWFMAPRIVFHNGTHCGQIADLRRALGLPRVLG